MSLGVFLVWYLGGWEASGLLAESTVGPVLLNRLPHSGKQRKQFQLLTDSPNDKEILAMERSRRADVRMVSQACTTSRRISQLLPTVIISSCMLQF